MMPVPCAVAECPKPAGVPGTAKGLCSAHYWRQHRHGSLDLPPVPTPVHEKECEFPGCTKRQRARGYCATHWKRLKKHGDVNITKRHDWTAREDAKLLAILDRTPDGLAHGRPGEIVDAALILERSITAVASRLYKLRRKRLAALRESLRG